MAYSPQDAINKILGYKNEWSTANAVGNTSGANAAATKAQEYYKQLRENGEDRIANTLYESDLEKSKKFISDYNAKQGKSAIRPYYYNLGAKYGLSQSDIDNALKFDDTTGEVIFGGKNMGKPASISSDGVSYWDTNTLDNSFNDYISRTGTSLSKDKYVNQENDNWSNKLNELWGMNINDRDKITDEISKNPFSTDEAKAILGKYDLSAIQGRNNQLANGAASNGGNVDSYSAANAMRQQASLYSMGQQAVLDAHNSKISNLNSNTQSKIDSARQLLSDLGVQVQQVFNQDETAKNNQVTRDETIANGAIDRATKEASIMGTVPLSTLRNNNPYYINGKPNENIDYQALIEKAQAQYSASNDENEKARLKNAINNYRMARIDKVLNNPAKYGNYATGLEMPDNIPTAEMQQLTKQLENSLQLTSMGYEHEDKQLNTKNQQEKDIIGLQTEAEIKAARAALDMSKDEALFNKSLNAEQAVTSTGKSSSSGASSSSENTSKSTEKTTLSDSEVKSWVNTLNNLTQEKYGGDALVPKGVGTYMPNPDLQTSEYVASNILQSDLTSEQKNYLLNKFNIKSETIDTVVSDRHYR